MDVTVKLLFKSYFGVNSYYPRQKIFSCTKPPSIKIDPLFSYNIQNMYTGKQRLTFSPPHLRIYKFIYSNRSIFTIVLLHCINMRGFLLISRKKTSLEENTTAPYPFMLTNKVSVSAINELFVAFIGHVKSTTQNDITEKVYRITDNT